MIKCGIYKITSPKNKIYVGQAVNIDKRWNEYNINNTNLQKQPKVYRSIIKYGIENHKFEIIEECNTELLNEREIYWGEVFNVLGENGLNLKLGNSGGKCSEETKLKISEGLNGIKRSEETKNKISKSMIGKSKTKDHINNIIKGKSNTSDETKLKMSKSLTGKKLGKTSTGSGRKPGFKMSEEHKEKLRQAKIGKPSNNKQK